MQRVSGLENTVQQLKLELAEKVSRMACGSVWWLFIGIAWLEA